MTQISFPRHSLVQLSTSTPTSCTADPRFCLPMTTALGWSMMLYATHLTPLDSSSDTRVFKLIPIASDTPCQLGLPKDMNADQLRSYTSLFDLQPVASADGVTTTLYATGSLDWRQWGDGKHTTAYDHPVQLGDCFKLLLLEEHYSGSQLVARHYLGCTTCFMRMAVGDCYTSTIAYQCAEDSFGFDYQSLPSFYMRAELPLYLHSPLLTSEGKSYTRSDGSIVKLLERKEEVYELETDLMPYPWHRALDIALSHDTVTIDSPYLHALDPEYGATQFIKKEPYEYDYPKGVNTALAKGKCHLSNATAVSMGIGYC